MTEVETKNKLVLLALQIVLLVAFAVFFFFTVITPLDRKTFVDQMSMTVDKFADAFPAYEVENRTLPNHAIKQLAYGIIDSTQVRAEIRTHDRSTQIEKENQSRKDKAIAFTVFLVAIVVGIALWTEATRKTNFRSGMYGYIITIIFVGITEVIFLHLVSSKYISARPNEIKKSIADSVANWISENK